MSKRFLSGEIEEALSEALWEQEREPRTSLWHSFWDRLTLGGPFPAMPSLPSSVTPSSDGLVDSIRGGGRRQAFGEHLPFRRDEAPQRFVERSFGGGSKCAVHGCDGGVAGVV